jgi:outer membrane protein assembly factor BamB
MQRRRRLRAASLVLLASAAIGLSAAGAAGQEQTDWPQFQGGPDHGGFVGDGPQPPYGERWTWLAPAGDVLSAAIVVGERAISVGSQAVFGIDLSTGGVVWSIPRSGGPVSIPATSSEGDRSILVYVDGPAPVVPATPTPTSSPTAPGASPSGASDEEQPGVSSLVAVDLADRTELWRTQLEATSHSGVTIDGGTVYVGDRSGNVYAVSLDDGSFLWPSPAGSVGQVDAPVAVASGKVYVVRRDLDTGLATLMAFDATTGERVWPGRADDAAPTGGSAPAVIDGSVVVGSTDPVVRAFDASDGELRWSALATSRFSPFTSPAFAAGDVVVAGLLSGGLYRLDLSEGERVWSYQFNEVVLRSSPVVSGSTVLLGLDDGRLVAVDTDSGRLVWQSEPSAGALGAIALSSDTIVVVRAGEQAGLIAYEHDPSGSLIDEPSPTELAVGTTLGRYATAAVIVFVLAFVPGLVLARRVGPAQLEPPSDDEQRDPDAEQDESREPDDRGGDR